MGGGRPWTASTTWAGRLAPFLILCVLCSKYAVFHDIHQPAAQSPEPFYEAASSVVRRKGPQDAGDPRASDQFKGPISVYKEGLGKYERFVDQLINSTDEVVRTAAGHLRAQAHLSNCGGSPATIPTWSRGEGGKNLVVCTIVRNEAAALPEWIAFHWLQGAGKFIIYDDGSTDNPVKAIRRLIEMGIVEYERIPQGEELSGSEELQWEQMNACLRRVHATKRDHHFNYVTFLDLDEFMYPVEARHNSVAQVIQSRFHDARCLYVDRTYYGTSLRLRRPESGLVISNYIMRSPLHDDGYPKIVINISPHIGDQVRSLYSVHAIDTREDEKRLGGEEDVGTQSGGAGGGQAPPACLEQIQELRINHYSRSLEDYDTKIRTHYDSEGRYRANPLELFWERDRNEEFDDSAAVRYACQVTSLLAQL